ncbi:hypothetical protein, partial [Lachnoanaerobaculum orale]|uniref:hypothetical protein n=1 Tax=Lachnoanaerobaculum orale TaxID=979627 RepID=UPI0023A88D05
MTIESGITPKTERYERSSLVTKTEDLFKVVKPNEFVTNPMNLRFGALGYNAQKYDVSVSGYYDVFSIDGNNCSGFWNAYFKTHHVMNIFDNVATGSLVEKKRVKYSTIKQIYLSVPTNIEEKNKISKFMILTNHLITLHQSKSLGHILKTIASRTLYWEQRKLGEMYTQLVERNIELLPFKKILSVSTMTYKGDGNGAAEESLSSYKRLRVGDIAFEGHTSKDFRYGRFVLNDTGDGIMSPRFSALRPISVMPIKFWKYYIHYEPIMKKILVNSTKSGTMMNELVVEEFLNELLLVPEEFEQQKIGRFFNGIDHFITLHQLEPFQLIFKAIAYRIIDYAKSKSLNSIKQIDLI